MNKAVPAETSEIFKFFLFLQYMVSNKVLAILFLVMLLKGTYNDLSRNELVRLPSANSMKCLEQSKC